MNLIENYLQQVESHLSSGTDKDVLQELESDIYDNVEEMKSEKGDELKDEDIALILRKFGSPMEVAAKFAKQQYLVGPGQFPVYRHSLKVGFSLVFILQILFMAVGFFTSEPRHLNIAGLFVGTFNMGIWVFAGLTLVFACVERFGNHQSLIPKWDPLKMISPQQPAGSGDDAIYNIIGNVALLFFWNKWVGSAIDNTINVSHLSITVSDTYLDLFWPVNALLFASIIISSWQLLSKSLNVWRVSLAMLLDVASIVVIVMLMASAEQIVVTYAAESINEGIATHAHRVFKISLAVVCGFIAYDIWKHVESLKKLKRG